MTVVIRDGFRWIADSDGLAHATPLKGRPMRTLCGLWAIEERYAYPAVLRCAYCNEIAQGTRRCPR